MAAVGPDNVGYQPGQNEYYKSDEEYIEANAQALKTEYKAIADAGFILQIDTPVMKYNALSLEVDDFRKRFGRLMELYNDILSDIPEEQIRLHICYGGMRAPAQRRHPPRAVPRHPGQAQAAAFSLDQNVQHEHEWRVWKDVKLPDGKALIPGVVAHTTDTIEHPRAHRRPHRAPGQRRRPRKRPRRHGLRSRRPRTERNRLGQVPRHDRRRPPGVEGALGLANPIRRASPRAAVHVDGAGLHVAARLGRQERRDLGDFLRLAHTARRQRRALLRDHRVNLVLCRL